jgi:succinoglycan biosynthesis transport protein ExoP
MSIASPLNSPGSTAAFIREATSSFIGVLKAVRKHWPVVTAAVAIFAGSALLYSKSVTKIYQSDSLLEISSYVPQPLGEPNKPALDMGAFGQFDNHAYYETQYKIIVSSRVLSAVVRDLGLMNDPTFVERKPGVSPPAIEDVAAKLGRNVTVEPVKYSQLVWLKVTDPDKDRARRICDALGNAYIAQNLETAVSATADAASWLSGQLDHVKQDLEGDEDALYDFKQRNDLPSTSINESSNMLRLEMQEFDTALAHTRTKKAELAARYEELSKVSADNPDELPASELLGSAFLQGQRGQYQDAVKERMSLLAEGKGENHPLVKRVDERIAETKTTLLGEIGNVKGAVQRDLAIVSREEASEAALFETTRRRAVDLNMKEIEYHRLDRARDQNEKLYGVLLERMKESDLARMMRVNNIRVVDRATEPHEPVRPRTGVNLAIGLFIGLVLGIGAAWVREQLDSTIRTPDEVETALKVTFLGLLPEVDDSDGSNDHRSRRRRRRRASGPKRDEPIELVVHDRPLSGIAEAARTLRTNLLFMSPDRPFRKLLVSSAAPFEGKTTIACSIAIALAQGGQRVCIVDCDLRRPRLHRIFGRVGEAGVTNVLVGEATIEDVAKPTKIDNLWSIPAGPTPPNPADVLHSDRFKQFLEDLGRRFDRVIVDSPPLVAVTDSAIISRLVDGTVFVVRAFKTSKHLSAQGLRALHDVDARVIGAVLNAVDLNRQEYAYYYHYNYYGRQGYYTTPAQKPAAENQSAAPN